MLLHNDHGPARRSPLLFALLTSAACGPQASDADPGRETGACIESECLGDLVCLSDVCVDPSATTATSGSGPAVTGEGSGGADSTGDSGPPPIANSVSILVVLDNSGSMGEEQAQLPAALAGLTDTLTAAGVDWRLAVTTSDNGNPWCDGTNPEGGQFVMSSCRTRTQDFVFAGAVVVDATDEACLDQCPAEWTDIALTPTEVDGGAAAPPAGVAHVGGVNNLPAGLTVPQALACVVPQGISGCGFESQLESMRKGVVRTSTVGEASAGFLPADALLAVVMVSDEADCSVNPEFDTIFLPDGNRVFWSNPRDAAPTSAVCWNAGVTCSGGDCVSADYDVNGNPAANPDGDAVLYPVARYLDELGDRGNALFALVGGVSAGGTAVYQMGTDPAFEFDFGIGPGCESTAGRAVPPVRMREVADAFRDGQTQNMFSICSNDYAPAMQTFGASILARLP
jgi:hypothetical protein